MELSEDLCRGDLFYDFVVPKLENDSSSGLGGLTPVAFIDSVDYITSVTDPNNNSVNGNMSTSPSNPIKSFIDEMLFSDSSPLSMNSTNCSLSGTQTTMDQITAEEINNATASLGLLSAFHWSSDGSTTDGTTSPETDTHWLAQSDGTPVTNLTNLLDPIFVTYQDEESPDGNEKESKYFRNEVVSSDLISSSYQQQQSPMRLVKIEGNNEMSPSNDHLSTVSWDKQNSPDSQQQFTILSTDSSMLLRTALQGGAKTGSLTPLPSIITFGRNGESMGITNNTTTTTTKSCDMIELRKVLSYPPIITNANGNHSPTSTSSNQNHLSLSHGNIQTNTNTNNTNTNTLLPQFFEFRILDSGNWTTSNNHIIPDDESNIPNVEELIMTRLDPDQSQRRKIQLGYGNDIGKINSTTTPMSTKWTYTTVSTNTNDNNNGEMKIVKRRKKQVKINCGDHVGESCLSSSGDIYNNMSMDSPTGVTGTSRKERSLHYCNICNKGFKDKYSVTVHIRTHTGEKPFSCSLCGKNFRQKAHLAKHYQTHAAKANAQAAGKHIQVKRSTTS